MSTRALAVLGATLLLLVAGAAVAGTLRYGWFRPAEPIRWRLQNALLDARPGQRLLLRAMDPRESDLQFFVSHIQQDPDPRADPWHEPYLAYGLAERTPGTDEFVRASSGFIPLHLLGALSGKEWVQEIRPVVEKGEGGRRRMVLRLRCGQEQGGAILYFFDPARQEPPVGWYRQEIVTPDAPTRVFYGRALD